MVIGNDENRDQEPAPRHHEGLEPLETNPEEVERKRGEDGLRQGEIEPHRAPREIEFCIGYQIGPRQFVRKPGFDELDLVASLQQPSLRSVPT
jgi:hypothetical protein